MFKKIDFNGLNYKELDRFDKHDLKRDELQSFYQTFDFLDLIKKWPDIIGPKLSGVTSPLKLKQDALFIMTKHPIYSQQLSFLAPEIKVEIFKVFPKLKSIIKNLVFLTQENFFQEQAKTQEKLIEVEHKLHPQSPRFRILKAEAEKFFGDIEDEVLKEKMISIYIQSK